MVNEPSITVAEWKLLLHLLERERADLPVEIHHSSVADAREHLRQRMHLVDELLPKLRQLADATAAEA